MVKPETGQTILRVLVGSHAHGLATKESDTDYRSVFIVATRDILGLNFDRIPSRKWSESVEEDNTGYELGEFLRRAVRCDPIVLEVFRAPVIESSPLGDALRDFFPKVWSSTNVHKSFGGYAANQRKKLASNDPKYHNDQSKYGLACLRVLIQGAILIRSKELRVEVPNEWESTLKAIRDGVWSIGEIIDLADRLEKDLDLALREYPSTEPDLEQINQFLIEARKQYW